MFCLQPALPPAGDQNQPDVLKSITAKENWAAASARIKELPADELAYFKLALQAAPVRTEKVVRAKQMIKSPDYPDLVGQKGEKVLAGVLEDFGGPCRGH